MSKGATKKKKSRPKRNEAQIPEWWLLLNDGLYFTLDLEDEKSRRLMEERMALYYSQLAEEEAAKGMMFDIDGNPLSAEESGGSGGGGGGWKSNWTGRQKKDGTEGGGGEPEKPKMFGGRNFKPGSEGWDPKQWGIDENDPDYDKYLRGEMLPPQYIAAMNNFAKATGHFKSDPNYTKGLRSTDGAAYGRLGEKQPHQPDWMKKKLRSTSQGQSIRHGVYDDSPNKHLKYHRRVEDGGNEDSAEQHATDPNPADQQENVALNSRTAPPATPAAVATTEPRATSAEPAAPEEPIPAPKPTWQHKDYYYNASTPTAGTAAATAPRNAPAKPSPNPTPKMEQEPEPEHVEQEPEPEGAEGGDQDAVLFANPDDEAEYEEEEYVEEEEVEEMVEGEEVEEEYEEYDEEVEEVEEVEEIEDGHGEAVDDGSLEDLQATLAAKMEELKRLQATQG